MNKKYPVVNKNFQLHITAQDCTLFYIVKNPGDKKHLGLKKFSKWRIHPIMARYLQMCDGKTTHEDIVSKLNVPFSILIDQGASYLESATNVIRFESEKDSCEERLFVTGNFESYNPLHISIEVTDYCNFRCKHCYVSSCPEKLGKRSYEDMIKLMDKLYQEGVKIIELTGGECTTHPQFKEILKYATQKFSLVSIISNGYVIGQSEELAEFMGSFDNIAVQISIDGLKEFHDEFRGKIGAFDNAVKAVKNLKKYDVLIRVATVITYENIKHIEDLYYLCKELDVSAFSLSPVSSVGRGNCFNCSNGDKELKAEINRRLYKFKDDDLFKANYLALEQMVESKEINCGAGWRTFAINGVSGDVRICLLLSDTAIIGNIDSDEYNNIFSKEKLDSFRLAPSPSPFLETCKDCEYKERCNGCIAKALDVYHNFYPDCPWAKKYNMIGKM
ncbi:MAG: radical SAM/SPASM domain-containing protein [Peptostreptococcaceae bacterium]